MTESVKKVLVSGHDLKFIQPLIERLSCSPRFEVRTSVHSDHAMSDITDAEKQSSWADAIFCEWAMGNAVWYSNHKEPGQTLVVRLHSQEIRCRLPFLWEINWEAVDHLVCICHHTHDWMCSEFPEVHGKAIVIYNPIDARSNFNIPRLPGSEFNIGFVGMVPKLKRLDIAFDIFSKLRDVDDRYTFHIKGNKPENYPWMLGRTRQLKWYSELEKRIESSNHRNAVVFDPHGPDMPEWYSAMGFILSTSDSEGSHQAVAEGMAAGCIPVIRDWEGASRIYPSKFIYKDVNHAVSRIRHWHHGDNYLDTLEECRNYSRSRFDSSHILRQLEYLLEGSEHAETLLPKPPVAKKPGIAILAFIQPGTRNGYRIRIEQEIRQYQRHTDNLSLIVLHHKANQNDLDAHSKELAKLGCQVYTVEIKDFFTLDLQLSSVLPAIKEIEEIIAAHNVSILHAEALYCMRVAEILAKRCTNTHILFDNHGVAPEEAALGGAHQNRIRALESIEQRALVCADLNIFVSSAMARHYSDKYSLPSYSHAVVPCCVDESFFKRKRESSSDIQLPTDRFIVAYIGSMAVWQCGREMLALFSQMVARNPNLFFIFLAPESEHNSARKAIKRAGIPRDAIVLKAVPHEHISSVLQQADLGMLVRKEDAVNMVSSPTKFAEYLASGVPILMTEGIGDYSEVCKDARLGLVIEPDKLLGHHLEDSTLETVESFISDIANNREQWRDRCRDYALTHLSWKSGMDELLGFFETSNKPSSDQ